MRTVAPIRLIEFMLIINVMNCVYIVNELVKCKLTLDLVKYAKLKSYLYGFTWYFD